MKNRALCKLLKRPIPVIAALIVAMLLPGYIQGTPTEKEQNSVYSIKIEFLSLKDAVKKIANETGHYFVFEDKDLE